MSITSENVTNDRSDCEPTKLLTKSKTAPGSRSDGEHFSHVTHTLTLLCYAVRLTLSSPLVFFKPPQATEKPGTINNGGISAVTYGCRYVRASWNDERSLDWFHLEELT